MNNKHILFTVALFFQITESTAQILNIDREVSDSMNKNWYGLISGSFSKDKQKFNIQDFNIYTEAVAKLNNGMALTYVGQIDAAISGQNVLQNEGFFQIRRRDLDHKKNSIEQYVQFQWNGAWGMKSRALGGLNLRKRILELDGFDLYLGLGGFVQSEVWNYNGVSDLSVIPLNPQDVTDRQIRFNSYLKGAVRLSKKCDFVYQSYFQSNALSPFSNPQFRWYWSSEIIYNITENWMIGLNYDHTYNQKNPVPIDKLYYGYLINLRFKF